MIEQIQKEILKLKAENDVCILAHSYQAHEIIEIADYTGDSYQLSVMASKASQKNVIMCGVRFMAETVKILSPDKNVYMPVSEAGCPMAEQFTKVEIEKFKKENPDYTVVAYINTTAELKTVCDVCVTSSSAVEIVRKIDNKNILFIPDINLGQFVAAEVPEKNIVLMQGGCPVHSEVTQEDAKTAKVAYPNALLLAHPECKPEVLKQADFVGSTSAIMEYAKKSSHDEFIIGTELSIAEHLQYSCPDKKFHPLSKKLICSDMKITTLMDVYNCLRGNGGEEILLDDKIIKAARYCLDEMIRMGG